MFEQRLNKLLLENIDPNDRKIIELIKTRVMRGESDLRKAFSNGITVGEIIYAIKHKKCIAMEGHDLGDTYLKNVIGNAIDDAFENLSDINKARNVFGLDPLQPKISGRKKLMKQIKQQHQRQEGGSAQRTGL